MENSDIYANKSQFKSDHNLDSILEPLSLESPMDVPNLVVKFSEEVWQEFGNTVSDEYLELWSIIFSKLNECDIRNRQSSETYNKYFVIPAPTGSGKTQCFRFYAAELARQNQDVGMVILSKFKSEIDETVEQINKMAGKDVAIAYYTGTEVKDQHNEEELDSYQIVVTTHQYFKLNHHHNAADKNTYRKVMSFNGHSRDVVVADEAIQFLDTFIITEDLVARLETKAYILDRRVNSKELKLELKLLSYISGNFKTLFYDDYVKTKARYIDNKLPALRRISLELNETVEVVRNLFNLDSFIQAIQGKQLDSFDLITPKQKTKLINYAKTLKHLLDDSLYWYNSQKYVSTELEKPIVSTVLFDATANINEYYSTLDYATIVQPLPKVKRYDNVVLKYVELGVGLGGDSIDNNLKPHFNNLTLLYRNITLKSFDDQIVVFTKKVLRQYCEKLEIPSSIDHFGNLVGVNHYKDDNYILIYGIPYKPDSLHYNNLYQVFGDDTFDVDAGDLISDLAHTNISSDIVQAINRGMCRKVIDGQAPETHIYLTLAKRDKKLNQRILKDIEASMVGINIKSWDVDLSGIEVRAGLKVNAKFDQLLDDVGNSKDGKVKLSNLPGYSSLTDKEKVTAVKHLRDKKHPIYAKVKEYGYSCTQSGQHYLIRN
jgi:hypothetical protein